MRRFAAILLGCAAWTTAFAGDEPAKQEGPPPPCIDAVLIARDIEFKGIPYRLPDGDEIAISSLRFGVDRVLYGKISVKQLTVEAPLPAGKLRPLPRRWLIFLAGSDAIGWRYIKRAEGVMRDTRGRDVYPVQWPLRSEQYEDNWLPRDGARFMQRVESDRAEEYWFCERYDGTSCLYRPPEEQAGKFEPVARYGLVLDELPKVVAELRKQKCLAASVGARAPSAEHYRLHSDFASLAWIETRLSKGMPRAQVLALLGEPDYSPTEGQDYYSSGASTRSGHPDLEVTLGLTVGYRERTGEGDTPATKLTDQLQSWSLGPIGE